MEFVAPAGRLTPARAGNTLGLRRGTSARSAHPRSRGEHLTRTVRERGCTGSPPLARGTLRNVTGESVEVRLTPARAGNTRCRSFNRLSIAAHPRSRGEHPPLNPVVAVPVGSPPLARGTLIRQMQRSVPERLTPARAGNTEHNRKSREY